MKRDEPFFEYDREKGLFRFNPLRAVIYFGTLGLLVLVFLCAAYLLLGVLFRLSEWAA